MAGAPTPCTDANETLLQALHNALEIANTSRPAMAMGNALIALTQAARDGMTLTSDHHAALHALIMTVSDGSADMLWGHFAEDRMAGREQIERLRPDSERLHRTLVRVTFMSDSCMRVVIPGWNPYTPISIERSQFDESVCPWEQISCGTYFMVMCNIGEQDGKKLRFSNWEVAPQSPRDNT